MGDFIARNKSDWQELEQLIATARKGARKLDPEQISRLDVLYRRATVHLAQVTTRTNDVRLMKYLNDLTAAAHSVIYLPNKNSVAFSPIAFFAEGFPRAIARTWRYQAISAVLLLGGALLAYVGALYDPSVAYALIPAGDTRQPGSSTEQLKAVLRSGRDGGSGEKFQFSSFLFSHNLRVGITSMALGVLAAVPTVLLLVYNGLILGAFAAVHHQAGIDAEVWAWLLPHGIPEMSAIILCGGIGLLLGDAVIRPGLLTRSDSLVKAGTLAVQICAGITVMLLIAAILESYLRQSHLSTESRLLFALCSAGLWIAYLAYGFVREFYRPDAKAIAQAIAARADAAQ